MQLVPNSALSILLRRNWLNCPVGPRLRAGPRSLDLCRGRQRPTNSFTSKVRAIPPGSISAFMLSSKHLTIARLPPRFSTRHLAPNLAIEFGQQPLRAASSSLAALSPSQMGSKGSNTARWHPNAAERVASASSRPRYDRGNWRGAFQDPIAAPLATFSARRSFSVTGLPTSSQTLFGVSPECFAAEQLAFVHVPWIGVIRCAYERLPPPWWSQRLF